MSIEGGSDFMVRLHLVESLLPHLPQQPVYVISALYLFFQLIRANLLYSLLNCIHCHDGGCSQGHFLLTREWQLYMVVNFCLQVGAIIQNVNVS